MELRVVRVNGERSPFFEVQERVGEKWVRRARGSRSEMRLKMIELTPAAVPTVVNQSLGRGKRAWAWVKRVFGVAR